jgi:phage terminase large subunit-like protein
MQQRTGNAAKRVADLSPGPWKRWKIKTRHGRAIKFMETYCKPPKGKGHGKPLKLAAFQKEWLEESLADGIDASVLQTPRGNGKSSLGGALATWAVFDDDETGAPQVPIIATTVGQAIRSCYGVAAAMIRNEPALLNRCVIYTGIGTSRVWVPFNDGELFPISNDPDGLQGLDYSFAVVDEIGFQPEESWQSLRLAGGKRERSLAAGLGTPGLDRDNALFRIRKLLKDGGALRGFVFREYSAPDDCAIDDREAWRQANPAIAAGFLRESALETDLGITQEGHFRAFRLGQWVEGVDAWLGANGGAIWEGLTNPYEFTPDARTYVGIDVAIKYDTSAVVAMQQRPDGRWHAICRVWVPTEDRPVDVTDIMAYLRELAATYRVETVSYDPRLFDVPAKMLSDEGFRMFELTQTPEKMTPAYVELYKAIMGGTITHDGDDVFTTQVLNGVARLSERGFTLEKGKSRGKIDAAVALCLAYDQVLRHESEPDSVYEERGLVEIG